TRGQVVTFLWRAAGEPEPSIVRNPFKDVAKKDYFYKAVLWAVEKGITKGTDAAHFSPNDTCTRGQIVTFLYRWKGEPKPKSTVSTFRDVKSKDYFYNAVLWAVENEITNGMDATHFAPNATCTRGQIVTFLYRGR
ncbi:MAG: S-layer homology domain-containing protein, partial [Clostridia bacterium]|nr:S-layer homology domain-containing protein [Clostridia bacterium]